MDNLYIHCPQYPYGGPFHQNVDSSEMQQRLSNNSNGFQHGHNVNQQEQRNSNQPPVLPNARQLGRNFLSSKHRYPNSSEEKSGNKSNAMQWFKNLEVSKHKEIMKSYMAFSKKKLPPVAEEHLPQSFDSSYMPPQTSKLSKRKNSNKKNECNLKTQKLCYSSNVNAASNCHVDNYRLIDEDLSNKLRNELRSGKKENIGYQSSCIAPLKDCSGTRSLVDSKIEIDMHNAAICTSGIQECSTMSHLTIENNLMEGSCVGKERNRRIKSSILSNGDGTSELSKFSVMAQGLPTICSEASTSYAQDSNAVDMNCYGTNASIQTEHAVDYSNIGGLSSGSNHPASSESINNEAFIASSSDVNRDYEAECEDVLNRHGMVGNYLNEEIYMNLLRSIVPLIPQGREVSRATTLKYAYIYIQLLTGRSEEIFEDIEVEKLYEEFTNLKVRKEGSWFN